MTKAAKAVEAVPAPFVATKSVYSKQIGIMVTPECYASIVDAAKNDGLSVSEYIRQLIDNDLAV